MDNGMGFSRMNATHLPHPADIDISPIYADGTMFEIRISLGVGRGLVLRKGSARE